MNDRAELDERIDAYLDGLLSPSETRALERMLVRPEVAGALAEALALREILASAPGDEPPAGLADRIIAALGVEGPDLSVVPPPEAREPSDYYGASGARSAIAGVGTMRYAFPLRLVGGSEVEDTRPWWRRTLSRRRS